MAYNIKKNETNTSLVQRYLEYGHAMNQAFLIEAVSQHAELVVKNKEAFLKEKNQAISHAAWVKCAEDWLQCLEDRRIDRNEDSEEKEK